MIRRNRFWVPAHVHRLLGHHVEVELELVVDVRPPVAAVRQGKRKRRRPGIRELVLKPSPEPWNRLDVGSPARHLGVELALSLGR